MRNHRFTTAAALWLAISTGCGSALSTAKLTAANRDAFDVQVRRVAADTALTAPGAQAPAAAAAPGGVPAAPAAAVAAGPAPETGPGNARSTSPGAAPGAAAGPGAPRAEPARSDPGKTTVPGPAASLPAPANPGAAPTTGAGEVRLGSVGVETGPLGAVMLPLLQAAKAWTADVNSRGGLGGRPVRLLLGDDAGDPSRSLALVRRMVEQDKVQAIFAERMPTTLQAVTSYLEEKQIPVIGANAGNPVIDESPMVFQVGVGAREGTHWAHILPITQQTDKRKIALLYCREVQTCSVLQDGITRLQSQSGITIVYKAQVSIAQPDYTAEMISARNAGAEVVLWIGDVPTMIRMARSAHRQGYSPIFAGPHSMPDDRLLKDGGQDIEGLLASNAVVPYATSPRLADYRAAIARYVPGGVLSSMGSMSWAAGKMIEAVARSFGTGEVTSKAFLSGLYGLRGETLGGVVPPTTYEPNVGHGKTNQCVTLVKVVGGKWVPDGDDQFFCAPGWKPVGR